MGIIFTPNTKCSYTSKNCALAILSLVLILQLFNSGQNYCSASRLKSVGGGGAPLQLESKLSHLTNILQDRGYQRVYDENLPKEPFKGKPFKPAARLAQGIIPLHYTLFIRPILEDTGVPSERFTAPGIVKISFQCQQPTTEVLIHAVELDIQHEFVKIRNRKKLEEDFQIQSREFLPGESIYRIRLDKPLDSEKEYILTIAFTAQVSTERLTGLYLSNYTDPVTGQVKYIATTQFESVHARKAFPCFDEPDLKATFDVNIGRKVNYNSVSNMNLIMSEPILGLKGWVWDHYNTSLRMSTYLVAWVVSDFGSETAQSAGLLGGRPVRTWAPKHWIDADCGKYGASVGVRVLDWYEKYFDTPYPLPKMDSIAIPHFQSGAMENWGANTYRERLLLHHGNKTTESERFAITSVISHELAHQNFGNLVTCKRWTHLWLNEGFATYVSFLGVEEVAPEFQPKDMFYSDTVQVALKMDTGPSVHPLVNDSLGNLNSAGDFDKITYKKGASLIHMMAGFLGPKTLQRGLQSYLKKYAFDNAVTDNLFMELDLQAHLDDLQFPNHLTVKDIMDTYTLKSGYPLVRVSRLGTSGRIYVTQEKFRFKSEEAEGKDVSSSSSPFELWWVPMSVKLSFDPSFQDTRPDFWLPKDVLKKQWSYVKHVNSSKMNWRDAGGSSKNNVKEDGGSSAHFDWLLVNANAGGYNRVIYDEALTKLLQVQLGKNPDAFPAVARAKLIDDYFNAASADYVSYETALGFTEYLSKETEHVVWTTTFVNIKRIYNMYRVGRKFNLFNSFFRPKVVTALDTMGMEQKARDRGTDVLLRTHLLDWACNLEYVGCTAFAKRMVKLWMNSKTQKQEAPSANPIPVDIQPVVYCSAVATADNDIIWQFIWREYLEAEWATEKFKLISALCCTQNRTLLHFLVDEAISGRGKINKVDASVALQRLAASALGNEMIFQRIQRDLHTIVKHFGGSNQVAYAISTLSIYWNEERQLEDLKGFVTENQEVFEPVLKLLRSSVKNVQDNIQWMARFERSITAWLEVKQDRALELE